MFILAFKGIAALRKTRIVSLLLRLHCNEMTSPSRTCLENLGQLGGYICPKDVTTEAAACAGLGRAEDRRLGPARKMAATVDTRAHMRVSCHGSESYSRVCLLA